MGFSDFLKKRLEEAKKIVTRPLAKDVANVAKGAVGVAKKAVINLNEKADNEIDEHVPEPLRFSTHLMNNMNPIKAIPGAIDSVSKFARGYSDEEKKRVEEYQKKKNPERYDKLGLDPFAKYKTDNLSQDDLTSANIGNKMYEANAMNIGLGFGALKNVGSKIGQEAVEAVAPKIGPKLKLTFPKVVDAVDDVAGKLGMHPDEISKIIKTEPRNVADRMIKKAAELNNSVATGIRRSDIKTMIDSTPELKNNPVLTMRGGQLVFEGKNSNIKINPETLGLPVDDIPEGALIDISEAAKGGGVNIPVLKNMDNVEPQMANKIATDLKIKPTQGVQPTIGLTDKEIAVRRKMGIPDQVPTYRGASNAEWQAIQKGEGFASIGESGKRNFVYVAEKPTLAGQYGDVQIEFKPSARDKMAMSGQVGGENKLMARNLDINDVQRVTDKNGNVIYDALSQPTKGAKVEPKSLIQELGSTGKVKNSIYKKGNYDLKDEAGNTSATFRLFKSKEPNTYVLDNIASLTKGKGLGSDALKQVTEAADRSGTRLALEATNKFEPTPTLGKYKAEKGLTTKQLKEWYGRNGFEEVEAGIMVREPVLDGGYKPLSQPTKGATEYSKKLATEPSYRHDLGTPSSKNGAVWFANKEDANFLAEPFHGKGKVTESYLDIKNPYVTHTGESSMLNASDISKLKSKGYDGVISLDKSGNIRERVVFDKSQILDRPTKGAKGENVTDNYINPKTGAEEPFGPGPIKTPETANPVEGIKAPERPLGPTLDEEASVSSLIPDKIKSTIKEAGDKLTTDYPEYAKEAIEKTVRFAKLRGAASLLTEYFGGFGGKLVDIMAHGQQINENLVQKNQPLLDEAEKGINKLFKNPSTKKAFDERLVKALEDRDNAMSYLKGNKEKNIFDNFVQFFDNWKNERIAQGKPVLENYLTHMKETIGKANKPRLDKNLSAPKNPFDIERIPEAVSEYSDDIIGIARKYDAISRREMAFSEGIKFYNENFDKIDPVYLNRSDIKEGLDYLQTWMKDLVNPATRTAGSKRASKLLQPTYSASLWNNPKLVIQNYSQRFLSNMFVGREARKMARVIGGETKNQIISDLRNEETTIINDLRGDNNPETTNSVVRFLKKMDAFTAVERGNWDNTGLKSIMEEVSQSPIYKELRVNGSTVDEAVLKTLGTPGMAAKAMSRAVRDMEITQVGSNKAFKPELWRGAKGGILPFFLQYRRFVLSMTELAGKIAHPQNFRETLILRRHVPEQTEIVDWIKKSDAVINHFEKMKSASRSRGYEGMTRKEINSVIKQISSSKKELQGMTKNYEKFTAGKGVKAFAKVWAIGSASQLAYDTIYGSFTETEGDDPSLRRSVQYGAPFMADPDISRLTTAANLPLNVTTKSGRKSIARVAPNFIPGVGVANRMIPGRPVSSLFETLLGAKTAANNTRGSSGGSYTNMK